MERTIMRHLQGWQHSKYRKPLFLQGVARSGKTWVLKEFGKRCYKNTLYFSFREHEEYRYFFEDGRARHAESLLQNLTLAAGQKIVPGKTLLILDDLQDCPEAVNALEVFYEQAPQFHIACAGTPFCGMLPIGKINVMELPPMTFSEVLKADGNEELSEYLEQANTLEPVPKLWFQVLLDKLKIYFVTGGMPEAVYAWIKKRDVEELQRVISQILESYEHSFSAYASGKDFPKILNIWKSLPAQLARENKKFFYKLVREGARAREYEDALNWLFKAQYIKKISRNTAPVIPFPAYDDPSSFRVYLPDVGLLRRMAMIPPSAFAEGNRLFTELCGALSENYVLTALDGQFEVPPRYWSQNNPFHEVDFIIQREDADIPMEVIPAAHAESRSMKKYCEKWGNPSRLRIRYSLDNLNYKEGLLNIPLFLADYTKKFIELTYEQNDFDFVFINV